MRRHTADLLLNTNFFVKKCTLGEKGAFDLPAKLILPGDTTKASRLQIKGTNLSFSRSVALTYFQSRRRGVPI